MKTFAHGIHPPENKEFSEEKTIEGLPMPPELIIPLSQHIGAPAKAIVAPKQQIVRGEKIADAGGFVSVPMHAPATGTVFKVDKALDSRGMMTPSIIIKVDPEADQTEVKNGESAVDISKIPADQIVGAVQETGMVGLGGAAFPTHVKMAIPDGKSVDTVIANGCECEPYLTCDHRVMLEQKDDLFTGLKLAMKATGAERAIIGIEANKPGVIDELGKSVPKDLPITVEAVKTKYPQGAEKMLITALLGRQVPSGGLPVDVGAGVFNVSTLAQLAQLMPKSRGLIERAVTVTGNGVKNPGNYMITLGTPVKFILDHVGLNSDAKAVVLGGPMMGPTVGSLNVPTTKGVSGILVLTEKEVEALPTKVYACIRCGECIQACPILLNPSQLGLLARSKQYETMEDQYNLNDCFECGACTYVCPSNIPLVQYFRIAKAMNRERKAAK